MRYWLALLLLLLSVSAIYWFSVFSRTPRAPIPEAAQSQAYRVEAFVQGLDVPWSMMWTSPERVLVAERSGAIRVVEQGELLPEPLHRFAEVSTGGEEGLMSLALHPEYARNTWVYASYAFETERGMWVEVVRFKDKGDSIGEPERVITGIPAARYHAGSRIRFGPDGKLYITTGDATDRQRAQDPASLAGKILRLNDDGTIPSDNPDPTSPVWSSGHRNPQGIDWHPQTAELYETEHGPSVFDGPAGGDEVNRIVRGGNYGWPLVSHEKTYEGTIAPLQIFTPAEAPGSGMFYTGDVFPQFKHNFFFGALRGEGLMRLVIDAENPDRIVGFEKLFGGTYGRIRDVAEGPDGFLYFATSNRDGRGQVREGDDTIYRLIPQ